MKKDRIIFTSAVCDLLHIGHLRLFEKASNLGKLIVAIPTSESNEIFKGYPTAISLEHRLRMVQALKCVHLCLGYHSLEELKKLILLIRPDVVCRGNDDENFNGRAEAESVGAKIVFFDYSSEVSSSKIAERVWKQEQKQQ
jgi:cytidyltransferase-like protein